MRIGQRKATSRHSRYYSLLDSVRRASRAFPRRACITCGKLYRPDRMALHVDPRCAHCAMRLAYEGGPPAELGDGD